MGRSGVQVAVGESRVEKENCYLLKLRTLSKKMVGAVRQAERFVARTRTKNVSKKAACASESAVAIRATVLRATRSRRCHRALVTKAKKDNADAVSVLSMLLVNASFASSAVAADYLPKEAVVMDKKDDMVIEMSRQGGTAFPIEAKQAPELRNELPEGNS